MRTHHRPRFLFMADSADGNGLETTTPAPQPPPTIPANAPAPVAAGIVAAGKKTEADVAADLDAKKLQTRIAQLEDERRQLLQAQSVPPPTVVAQEQKKSWLEGGSFFD